MSTRIAMGGCGMAIPGRTAHPHAHAMRSCRVVHVSYYHEPRGINLWSPRHTLHRSSQSWPRSRPSPPQSPVPTRTAPHCMSCPCEESEPHLHPIRVCYYSSVLLYASTCGSSTGVSRGINAPRPSIVRMSRLGASSFKSSPVKCNPVPCDPVKHSLASAAFKSGPVQ